MDDEDITHRPTDDAPSFVPPDWPVSSGDDPKLAFLGPKMGDSLDDCDVWDGLSEGRDDVGAVEGVEGEEEDLVLDMLRSQEEGQFIIAGESVIADVQLTSGPVPGGRGEFVSEAVLDAVIDNLEGSAIVLGDVGEKDVVSFSVGEVAMAAGVGDGKMEEEVREMDVVAVIGCGVDGEEGAEDMELGGEVQADVERVMDAEVTVHGEEEGAGEEVKEVKEGEMDVEVVLGGGLEGEQRGEVEVGRGEEVEVGKDVGLTTEKTETGMYVEVDGNSLVDSEQGQGKDIMCDEVKEEDHERGLDAEVAVNCGVDDEHMQEEEMDEVKVREADREVGVEAVESDGVDGEQGDGEEMGEVQKEIEMVREVDGKAVAGTGLSDSLGELGQLVDGGDGEGDQVSKELVEEVHCVVSGSDLAVQNPSVQQGAEVKAVDLGVMNSVVGVSLGVLEIDDSQLLDATMLTAGETGKEEDITPFVPVADAVETGVETEHIDVNDDPTNLGNVSTRGGGKKKRGRQPKVQTPKSSKKKSEEDVCFICFDGGNLVVCDRRGCPKVYHPSCINREESFFKAKGRWNCGWHICSICEKAAHFMCYTCTYSLCKSCMKESQFVCIRGNKGLCETCRSMVMLIETNDPAAVNFYDKSTWEYLFKDYWIDVKEKLSLTFDEINKGKNPLKKPISRNSSPHGIYEANDGSASSSDDSSGRGSRTRKRAKRRQNITPNEESSVTVVDSVGSSVPGDGEWASKDLLEFVSHMKGGDTSVLSQFDVQALLLEYIKQNKLRDPRRKSQIVCDPRLENLFGKSRVGHFEMLKLLESHFLIKETSHVPIDDDLMPVGDPDWSPMDAEGSSDAVMLVPEKRRKGRKKGDKEAQTNFDDYAAIDTHNISLIYLKRCLVEEMIDDAEHFNDRVVGSFVRIRIPATGQKQDMYRLVKTIGTSKAAEKYQAGKKTTDLLLEILNLNKTETISIDTISNQEFTEEECKRLRQSIKYGFVPRMTVGELQEKARDLQPIKVKEWLEIEKARLIHLRDRASDMGRRKELRECVEKLEFLPEDHARRLNEIPEVHADHHMDPNYESAEEEPDDRKRDNMHRPRDSGYFRKGKDHGSSEKVPMPAESWSGSRKGSITSSPRGVGDVVMTPINASQGSSWVRGVDMPQQNSLDLQSNRGTAPNMQDGHRIQAVGQVHLSANASVSIPSSLTGNVAPMNLNINESEKIWHYQDPTGKVQGPFSMVQLRKWNSTGYFPRDLRIWKTSEKQEDSLLLTDALIGKLERDLPTQGSQRTSVQPLKPSVMDNREVNRDAHGRGNSDSSWAEKKLTGSQRSGTVGAQEHGGARHLVTSLQSNGPTFDGHAIGSSFFQQLPTQQTNLQSIASGFGAKPILGSSGANSNALTTFNSNASNPARSNQSRARVSRWEPESGAIFVQSGTAVPVIGNATTLSGNAAAPPVLSNSPTPTKEQLGSDSGVFSVGRELPSDDPNKQNNFSPIRVQGSQTPNTVPDNVGGLNKFPISETSVSGQQASSSGIAPADMKNTDWSMPSPTPSSEVVRVDIGAQVAPVNNPSTFIDSNQLAEYVQLKSESSVGPLPQAVPQQMQGAMVNTIPGWGFGPENMGAAVATQPNPAWNAALPANNNMGWVAPGTSNIGWNALTQGTTILGWAQSAAGTPVVNPVPQMAIQGTLNPLPVWGAVGPVIPQVNPGWGTTLQQASANPGWGTSIQGFSNANPGWAVPQPANADPSMAWGAQVAGNPNPNGGRGMPNGNSNGGWNSPSGNPNNWGPHQRDQKDRHSRNPGYSDSGHGNGRHRMHSGGGGPSRDHQGQRLICWFHENGHCKKGSSCNFIHT